MDTKSVQIRSFPIALWRRVKVAAAEMGVGLSEFVIESVRRRLDDSTLTFERMPEKPEEIND